MSKIALNFIKKSRPKLRCGDIFYYHIDNKFYYGIVLLTQLDPSIYEGVDFTVLLPNYYEINNTNLNIDKFKEKNNQSRANCPSYYH